MKKHLCTWFEAQNDLGASQTVDIPPQNADGTWNDVDYEEHKSRSEWAPHSVHLSRVYRMAFTDPEGALNGLRAWQRLDPTSDNWWFQSIGTPMMLAPTLLILGDHVPQSLLDGLKPILERSQLIPGMTGQNRIWVAGNQLMTAIIYGENDELIRKARQTILDEIVMAPAGGEGLQADFTYHLHGSLMQCGNYGLDYFHDLVKWMILLRDSCYAFPDDKIQLIENTYRMCLRWFMFRGIFDVNACGRHIFHSYFSERKAESLQRTVKLLHDAGYLADSDIEHPDSLSGCRYFSNSAYLVHRRQNWYFSVRMCNSRLVGAENCNMENELGKFSADGSTIIKSTGIREPHLPAFPFFDWHCYPGTTELIIPDENLSPNGLRNQGTTAGLTDGNCGIAAIRLRTDHISADKAYFCLDDGVIAAGCGIFGLQDGDVITTIDQRLFTSPCVFYDSDGSSRQLDVGTSLNLSGGTICHDGIVYHLEQPGNYTVLCDECEGNWKRIANEMQSEPVVGKRILLTLSHGKRPQNASYFYSLQPIGAPSLSVIRLKASSPNIIAIYDSKSQYSMIAGFEKGTVKLPEYGILQIEMPGLYMIRNGQIQKAAF